MPVVIVGVSTRAIAQSACRAGYDICTVDFFGDYDQKLCCPNVSLRRDLGWPYSAWGLFQAVFPDAAQAPAIEGVVYLANLENHPEVIAAFERRTRVLGNGVQTVAAVRDWETLVASVNRLGGRTPRTLQPGEITRRGRWLAKPRRSGGGHGIRSWKGSPSGGDWLVQEHIAGISCSVAFVADGRGAVILGFSEQLIGRHDFGARGFRYCGNIFPLAADPSAFGSVLPDLVTGLTQAFGLVGVGGVDFVLTDTGPVVLEVNPRYTGSMELIEHATGMSIFGVHLRALEGELPDPDKLRPKPGYWGKAIVFARREVVARNMGRWLRLGVCDIPFEGERIRAGSPVCTVVAWGTTRTACLAALQSRADEIWHDLDG
jgi:predicted ATP-grasp superfamily ATP-dependent carboligase